MTMSVEPSQKGSSLANSPAVTIPAGHLRTQEMSNQIDTGNTTSMHNPAASCPGSYHTDPSFGSPNKRRSQQDNPLVESYNAANSRPEALSQRARAHRSTSTWPAAH